MRGQEFAKRALEVATPGGHNILMMWIILSFLRDRHILGCPQSCSAQEVLCVNRAAEQPIT